MQQNQHICIIEPIYIYIHSIYSDAAMAGPQELPCFMTSIIFDGRESWSFSSMAEPCSPLLNNTGHRTLRKHSWQPCRTSLRRHPKKMSVETPDFPSVKLARNTSKTSELRSVSSSQDSYNIQIRNEHWPLKKPKQRSKQINTSFRKLNQSSSAKLFQKIRWNFHEWIQGLCVYCFHCFGWISFPACSHSMHKHHHKIHHHPAAGLGNADLSSSRRSLSAKVGRLYRYICIMGNIPFPVKNDALLQFDPKHTIILVCSIWLHKYPLDLSFQKRWWSKISTTYLTLDRSFTNTGWRHTYHSPSNIAIQSTWPKHGKSSPGTSTSNVAQGQ